MGADRDGSAAASGGGYGRVVAAGAVGTFMEIYDLLVYGYFAGVLAGQFFPRADPTAALLATFAIFALGFVVRPVGAIIFGHVGDRVGRRPALITSLVLMSASTLAFGLLPTYHAAGVLAPVLLLVCRIMQGLSASGESTGANLLVLEQAPPGRRGIAVATINAAGNLGTACAAAIGFTVAKVLSREELATWGWRVAFLAAAPIGMVGLYLRIRVLDSPEFRQCRGGPGPVPLPIVGAFRTARRGLLVLVAWTAVSSLGGYMLAGFLPSYLMRVGRLSPASAFASNGLSILVLALSTMAGGFLVDRYPLRRVALGVLLGVLATTVPAFLLIERSETLAGAIVGQGLWAAFLGADGLLGAVLGLAMFPVLIRFTGLAFGSNLAITLFGSTAPYVCTWLVARSGNPLTPALYLLAVGALAAVPVWYGLRSWAAAGGVSVVGTATPAA